MTTYHEQRYFKLALTLQQQTLAKRLAALPEDERLDDPEFSNLDQHKPRAALTVLMYAQSLTEENDQ